MGARILGVRDMTPVEIIKAAYAAFGRNDPSVLFGAMDAGVTWHEAEGNPLADHNPYVGPQAIGEGVFGRLLSAIDGFSAVPATFIDGGNDVVVLGRYGGTIKTSGAKLDAQFCHVYHFRDGKIVRFQQYTDSAQWARLLP
jgi:ketosteroid isomerase-like protein